MLILLSLRNDDWPASELLKLYKSRIGIERNLSFIKGPAIANSIFLKKAERIEVPALALLVSLLIWRLTERSMRRYIEFDDRTFTWPGSATNKEADSLYDDRQIHRNTGHHHRETSLTRQAVKRLATRVFKSIRRYCRCIHVPLKKKKVDF